MICQVEIQFKLPGKVHGVAMSSVSTTHMLIAAGTEDVQVRLCDMASGAFTHTLSGHRGILQILIGCVFTFYLIGSFWRSRNILFWDRLEPILSIFCVTLLIFFNDLVPI